MKAKLRVLGGVGVLIVLLTIGTVVSFPQDGNASGGRLEGTWESGSRSGIVRLELRSEVSILLASSWPEEPRWIPPQAYPRLSKRRARAFGSMWAGPSTASNSSRSVLMRQVPSPAGRSFGIKRR